MIGFYLAFKKSLFLAVSLRLLSGKDPGILATNFMGAFGTVCNMAWLWQKSGPVSNRREGAGVMQKVEWYHVPGSFIILLKLFFFAAALQLFQGRIPLQRSLVL